jgi:hypothetical protein
VNGSTLTITGAGSVVVTANQAGNNNYSAAVAVSHTISANKAPLTVTATNASVLYNQAIPKLAYVTTGFVNGDAPSVVSGAPVEATTAKQGSAPGTYPITITQGTLAAVNYSFSFVNGTLTVTPLGVTATPAFSPLAGTYASAQTVTINDTMAGATIYYTTNGSAPTTTSTKYTSAGIKVSATETINTIAVATGYSSSTVATATYTIATAPTVTTSVATSLSTSSATLNATVTANNATTQYWFAYGTSRTALTSTTTKTGELTGTAATQVSAGGSGLKTGTTYYFQAVASNAVATTSGTVLSFTTK